MNFGRKHPDPVVESSSLSSVSPPDIHYRLTLPEEVIDEGFLSALQLEAVVYACQRHECILPNGQRAGFLIGEFLNLVWFIIYLLLYFNFDKFNTLVFSLRY